MEEKRSGGSALPSSPRRGVTSQDDGSGSYNSPPVVYEASECRAECRVASRLNSGGAWGCGAAMALRRRRVLTSLPSTHAAVLRHPQAAQPDGLTPRRHPPSHRFSCERTRSPNEPQRRWNRRARAAGRGGLLRGEGRRQAERRCGRYPPTLALTAGPSIAPAACLTRHRARIPPNPRRQLRRAANGRRRQPQSAPAVAAAAMRQRHSGPHRRTHAAGSDLAVTLFPLIPIGSENHTPGPALTPVCTSSPEAMVTCRWSHEWSSRGGSTGG